MDRARLFFLTNEVTADSSINKALGQELEKTIKKIIEEMPGVVAADSDIAARTYANSIQELVESGKLAPAIDAFDQLPLESRKKIMQQVSDERFNTTSKKKIQQFLIWIFQKVAP